MRIALFAMLVVAVAFVPAAEAQTPLTFSKAFAPATIGPGSVSTLRFDIVNNTSTPVTGIAFTDNMPADVTLATPANAFSTCEGDFTAPDGGTTFSFSGGRVGGGESCTVDVDVTSSTAGIHANVSGDLTSIAGNSGSATANLTVAVDRPGFSKSFSPDTVFFGERSTLTFTIDNTANTAFVQNLSFTDNFPDGMIVASPANASTTCGTSALPATLTANAGASVISLFANGAFQYPAVAAAAACTVTVDVVANAAGALHNVSDELTSNGVSSGAASATLTATAEDIALIKEFIDDPAAPGDTATLEFRIRNFDRGYDATSISFGDSLESVLAGLAPSETLPKAACGGTLDFAAGTLSLSGGSISYEGDCAFSVELAVPAGAVDGAYPNITTEITAFVNGQTVTGNAAKDTLYVSSGPILTKEFTDDPVGAGGDVTLRFSIANVSAAEAATDIAFTDELTTFLPFPIVVTPSNPDPPCGTGSSLSLISLGTERQGLSLTGGNLAAGGSCMFEVTITVPAGVATGAHTNTTSEVTATVNGEYVIGDAASDDLVIVGGPTLVKEFIDDPAQPGGTATLQFTISLAPAAADGATGIGFTDDLSTVLAGLAATDLPKGDICGDGSLLAGTTSLSFTGGSLGLGETCTFSVALQVPSDAAAGNYANQTSSVTATVAGQTTIENPASDILRIAGLALTKEFTDDPVQPGDQVTLRYTIANTSPNSDATDIAFFDDFDDALDNLAATSLPSVTDCGTGASLTGLAGNQQLQFLGGSLGSGESCTFDVILEVPVGAADDTYPSRTSLFSAKFDGTLIAFDNATDDLTVFSQFLSLIKDFTDDPVVPGGAANLEFTISNIGTETITGIGFSDDLNAAYPGLAATGPLSAGDCDGSLTGTTVLTYANGSLAAGSDCSFSVSIIVPTTVPNGTVITNTTSEATGMIGSLVQTADAATADLVVTLPLDVGPSIGAVVVPGSSNEGDAVVASATFTGPAGIPDSSYSCTVDYGDGSGPVAGSISSFTCTGPIHVYGDNGDFSVTVTVADASNRFDSASANHTVDNVAPTVSVPATSSPTDEGSLVTASSVFNDPGSDDSPFTCTVDYGDGPVAGTINGTTCTGPGHTYGDNGSFTVTISVTDKDGGVGSASATHTVDNVAPSVSAPVVTPVGSTNEGETVSASADFSDPGFDDTPFTCTVDYGDGAGAVAGTVTDLTCTGPFHTYGDNGSFTVTVAVTDKDNGEGAASSFHQVDNLDPTVTLDMTGAIGFPGGDAFIGRQGVPQEHHADGDDQGSDDLTFRWDFSGEIVSTTYFNDTGDPSGSPDGSPSSDGTFPFSASDIASVTFLDAGSFEVNVELTDDDGGFDSQALAKLVSGDEVCVRTQGFWRHQFKSKKPHFSEEALQAFLDYVDSASSVFSEVVDAYDAATAGEVFEAGGSKRDKANSQALAAWLNIASGAVGVDDIVDFDDGSTFTVLAVMASVEATLNDHGASDAELVEAASLAKAITYLVNEACEATTVGALLNYGIEVEFAKGCWVAYIPSTDDCIDCKDEVAEAYRGVNRGRTPVSGDLLLPSSAKGGGASCSAFGSSYLKIREDRLEWQISNPGGETITIDRISIYWPEEYGDLGKITLRNVTIFDHVIGPASTTIDAGWRGHEMDRQIEPGTTKKLKLEFGNARESETRERRPE